VKAEASTKFNCSEDKLCLIFAGKILKDEDSLEKQAIKDGFTIHLVIRAGTGGTQTETPSTQTPTNTTRGFLCLFFFLFLLTKDFVCFHYHKILSL